MDLEKNFSPPASKFERQKSNPPVGIMECVLTQVFNRRSISFLWDKRGELDAGQVAIINSIYHNKKKGGTRGSQQITYKLSRSCAGKLGYGRLYGSKGSFETLEKECRGTICREFYHDIDMVNCHPVLLVQFARRKYPNQPDILSEVQRYNENREAYLAEVMSENSISRDEAKQAVISVLYGGLVNKDSYLHALSHEVRGFSKNLYNNDPEFSELAKVLKSEKNLYGSFLSYILQTEERKCMWALKGFLESQKWSVDVLAYDGVMIRKREGVVCDSELLGACSTHIFNNTGYNVALTTKEFAFYDMPLPSEEVAQGVTLEAYQEMKMAFEKSHFYHAPSDKIVEVDDNSTLLFMDMVHAKHQLNNKWHFRKSEKFNDYVPFFDVWFQDTNKRTCYSTSFKDSTDDRVFKIPINFAYTKATAPDTPTEAIPLFLEIVGLITSGDSILTEYVLNWTSHLVQRPTDLPGVGLVLTGEKGVGKDTFGDFLQEFVVGRHLSTNYTTNKQFFGTHDTGKLNKFLIKLEETSKKDCFDNASELKSSITAVQVTANPKGVQEITADNFARFLFTTNKPNPVDMSDGERRFVLLPCSNSYKGNYDFWTKVRSVLFTPSAGAEVARFLLNRDITTFQIRKLPENKYQTSIIKSEETSEQQFVAHWDGVRVSATGLYDLYKEFCINGHLPYAGNSSWFGKNIQSIVRKGEINNTIHDGYSYYEKPAKE